MTTKEQECKVVPIPEDEETNSQIEKSISVGVYITLNHLTSLTNQMNDLSSWSIGHLKK